MSQDTTLHHLGTPGTPYQRLKISDAIQQHTQPLHSHKSFDSLTCFALSPPTERDEADDVELHTATMFAEPPPSARSTLGAPTLLRKRKQLNVIDQKHGDGKLLYMAARSNHRSYGMTQAEEEDPCKLSPTDVPTRSRLSALELHAPCRHSTSGA